MRDQWAGIPMPIDGARLIIEPRFPKAKELAEIGNKDEEPTEEQGSTIRNRFHSAKRRCDVVIWNRPDGSLQWGLAPAFHHIAYDLTTLQCSVAWGIEQENNALKLLGTLVKHSQLKSYLLTGMFMEQSKRSEVYYLFRRMKPTVAIRAENDKLRVLCCLCMHPIAYYAGSWAGAMCPTDDVIAHLMLMRADEAMYWRRANQHAAFRPEAGL